MTWSVTTSEDGYAGLSSSTSKVLGGWGGGGDLEHPQSSCLREQAVALLMIAQYIIQYIDLLKIEGTFFSISVRVCRQHCAGGTPGTRPVLQSSALLCVVAQCRLAQCRLAQCRLAQCFCACLAPRWGDPWNSSSASILCSALCSGSVPLGSVPLGSVPFGSVFLCVFSTALGGPLELVQCFNPLLCFVQWLSAAWLSVSVCLQAALRWGDPWNSSSASISCSAASTLS